MTGEGAGISLQVRVLFGRCWRGFVNDRGWKVFVSVALIVAIIALVLGDRTFQDYPDTRNGAFALICAGIWIGIFNSIRTICRERDIVRRERRTGLSIPAYLLARWLFEALVCAAEALLVTVLVRLVSGDHFIARGVFLPPLAELAATFFLVIFSSDALGLFISSIVPDESTAMTIMPFALIIQLVMSGLIFELKGVADAISNLTISRWGLDAICATAHMNEMSGAGIGYPQLDEYAATMGNLTTLWGILALFAVAYAALAILALSTVDR